MDGLLEGIVDGEIPSQVSFLLSTRGELVSAASVWRW